jgi:signal transduction histidine kinase
LAHRLEEFITFTRPVQAGLKMTPVPPVLDKVLQSLRTELPSEKLTVSMEVPPELPSVYIDAGHLQTVLQAVLRNAIESMPQGGPLTIAARAQGDGVRLEVRDKGAGIAEEHLRQVGKPFFTTKAGAIGLGLASAKRLLHLYGGELTLESRPGEGTTVVLTFGPPKSDV